jgi:hypothetical protein
MRLPDRVSNAKGFFPVGRHPARSGVQMCVTVIQTMKCPHCYTAIPEGFAQNIVVQYPQATSRTGQALAPPVSWFALVQRCPACQDTIIYLRRHDCPPHMVNMAPQTWPVAFEFLSYPRSGSRPIPSEVPSPYRDDFSEACKVLADSSKASAALSRRCLQAVLRDKAGTKKKDLADQIDEVVQSGSVPPHIQGELDAVRVIGNFAAHPTKSTGTGEIIDVEPGEAEWNLDVLESLFEFYFVQPGLTATRKAALNVKLKAAGKPELP